MAAPMADDVLFGQAVGGLFKSWTALQLAVSHGFGGAYSQQKAEWLVYATETWFSENARIETYECEEFLDDILNQEFDLIIDDGSTREIANKICRFYELYKGKKYEELKELMKTLPTAQVQNCQKAESDDEEVDEFEANGMEEEPTGSTTLHNNTPSTPVQNNTSTHRSNRQESNMETEEEDDGWTVVRKGKNK